MLTEIYLENFKCHKKIELKELKPLTIITGPNNAGKSVILQSLFFIHQWRISRDVRFLETLPSLHTFGDMIYQKDTNLLINIGLTLDKINFESSEEKQFFINSKLNLNVNEPFTPIRWNFRISNSFDLNTNPNSVYFNNRLVCSFQSIGYSKEDDFLDRPLLEGDSYVPFQILNPNPPGISPLTKVLNREYQNILDNLSYFLPMRGLRNWTSPLDLQTNKINEEGAVLSSKRRTSHGLYTGRKATW